CSNAQEAIANSKDPMLHLFTVPNAVANSPQQNIKARWAECGPDTVGGFSGVAYFFGRDLRKALHVPVGLIHTSWGGTPAESWTTRSALAANPDFKWILDQKKADNDPWKPTGLYNAMIAPLQPYAIRGAIWYQGESNAGRAYEYR